MAKQIRNIFLALIVIVNFSSCSYHYFYPQRVNVYAFDSSGQTKAVIEPSFNIFSLHFGVAHSFSDHIFSAFDGQFNTNIADWSNNKITGNSFSYSGILGLGYYKMKPSGLGFEIVPGFTFEKNEVRTTIHNGSDEGQPLGKNDFHYLVPSVQSSIYKKGKEIEWYFTGRISYLFVDSLRKRFTPDYLIYDQVFYPRSFLFEPGIQFDFTEAKWMRWYISGHLSTSKTDYFTFLPPFQIGVKFIIL